MKRKIFSAVSIILLVYTFLCASAFAMKFDTGWTTELTDKGYTQEEAYIIKGIMDFSEVTSEEIEEKFKTMGSWDDVIISYGIDKEALDSFIKLHAEYEQKLEISDTLYNEMKSYGMSDEECKELVVSAANACIDSEIVWKAKLLGKTINDLIEARNEAEKESLKNAEDGIIEEETPINLLEAVMGGESSVSTFSTRATALADTTSESELYNNIYYPQSVYNGGINSPVQVNTGETYVDPATGNVHHKVTDLVLPGKGGLDLEITRIYNSQNSQMFENCIKEEKVTETKTYYKVTATKRADKVYKDGTQAPIVPTPVGITREYLNHYHWSEDKWMAQNTSKFEYTDSAYVQPSMLFTSYSNAQSVQNAINNKDMDICVDEPYDEVRSYIIDYTNAVITPVTYAAGQYIYYESILEKSFNEAQSILGIGWNFDFPYIETRSDIDDSSRYLHFGDKGTWRIDFSEGGENNLIGYDVNDIKIVIDNSVIHDSNSSRYCVTEKDGIKYYFASDGRLLVKRDRYGNEIKFYCKKVSYKDYRGKTRYAPKIYRIVDTVGREIRFDVDTESSDEYIEVINMTVASDDETKTYIYYLDIKNEEDLGLEEYMGLKDFTCQKRVLSMVADPDDNYWEYGYNFKSASASFMNRNDEFYYLNINQKNTKTGNTYINSSNINEIKGVHNNYALLIGIISPIGKEYCYTYAPFMKNCTPDGTMVFYKPYESESEAESWIDGYKWQKNKKTYIYDINNVGEYDGYHDHEYDSRLPENYNYEVQIADASYGYSENGKYSKENYLYTYLGEQRDKTMFLKRKTLEGTDHKVSTEYTYDVDLKLINGITQKEYSANKSQYMESTTAYVYDSEGYGDVITETPNGTGERAVNCTYDSVYHFPLTITYKKDADTTVREEYTKTANGKNIASAKVYVNGALKGRTDYTYDSYGNILNQKEYINNTEYKETQYAYQDGVYLTSEKVKSVLNNDNVSVNLTNSFTYDSWGNQLSVTDAEGNKTQYKYDLLNRLTKVINPDLSTKTYSYDCYRSGMDISETDELSVKIENQYNADENLRLKNYLISLKLYQSRFYYNEHGVLGYEILYDENKNVVRKIEYTYDTLQRLTAMLIYDSGDTLVYKETYSYDTTSTYNKKTTTVWGGTGNPSVVTSEYTDKYGNIIKTETGSSVETYTTDYAGNILTVKSAKANAEGKTELKSFEYDYMGNVVKETNELGVVTSAEYDFLGRMIKSTDADGNTTEYTYDKMGRLIMQKTPFEAVGGTTYYSVKKIWYDNNGNVIKESVNANAVGEAEKFSETKYTYDNRNRLVMTETNDGKESNYVQYYYDAKGNLLRVYKGLSKPLTINGLDSVIHSGDSDYSVIKYTYDSLGRLLTTTDALGNTETNTYDKANGLLLSSTDRNGNSFSYTYDGLGNLTSKALSDGTNQETTAYGLTGQVLSTENGTTRINYVYDNKGQLISETDSNAGTVKEYTYDANGNRLTFTLKRNGASEISQSYTYDMLNRLTSVSENGTVIANYSYDNRNNRISTAIGNETTTYAYNLAGLLTNQTTGDKLTESYTYYLNGNQKSKTTGGEQTNYTYDLMNRLVKENETEYTFDDFGNRVTMSDGESTSTYSYDLNNRLTESNEVLGDATKNTKYFYDKNGNTVSKAVMTNTPYSGDNIGYNYLSEKSDKNVALYDYNCYNQVTGIDTNGIKSSYTYSPDGMRFSKTVGDDITIFVYDGANIVEEVTENGTNKYYRGFEIIKNSDGLNYIYNGQGDVAMLEDANGEIVASYIFDAYGNSDSENTVYNPFGYRGEYQDAESGLIYLRARMYDPETGRFISEDPVEDGLNWYVYCGNNPIMFVDPWGLVPTPEEAAAMADHIYHYDENSPYEDRLIKIDGEYTAWRLIDTLGGDDNLKIGIYVKTDRFHNWEDPLEYALVNKGTDLFSITDWKNNVQEFYNSSSSDLWESVAHAKFFVDNHQDYEITFIGHSKGGAEATLNALWTDRPAIVFNPSKCEATMHIADNNKITAYVVRGEVLNDLIGEPYVGNVIYLDADWRTSIGKHKMNSIIKGLNGRK